MTPTNSETCTVAEYLIARLQQMGVGHVFSVAGTACADFIIAVGNTASMQSVGTANELEAGYAADGYARVRGVGVACVTYGVGTLSLVNAVAGSLVEKCRVVIVNGGPSARELWEERNHGILFTHSTGRARTDYEVFRQVTASAQLITSAEAPGRIDAALVVCLTKSQPVYIEVANDLWNKPCRAPEGTLEAEPPAVAQEALNEAVNETLFRIARARLPVIWVGEEVQRFGLEADALSLIERSGLRFATPLLGKAILPESHDQFIGVYDSDLAPKVTRDIVEKSDCIIALGTTISVDHAVLVMKSYGNIILATAAAFRVGHRAFDGVPLPHFVKALAKRFQGNSAAPPQLTGAFAQRLSAGSYSERRAASMGIGAGLGEPETQGASAEAETAPQGITYERFFDRIDHFIKENMVVLVDTCLGSYPGADLRIKRTAGYIAQPVWLSIGYTVGATLGVGCALAAGERAVTIIGDGGFQMIAQAFSTMARLRQPAIMFVINNSLYGIEQFLLGPDFYKDEQAKPLFFNELSPWQYARLPETFGGGWGQAVSTMQELEEALNRAQDLSVGPALIEVHIPAKDLPPENREYIN
jgi:indolepyruvate decarboxylase